MTEQTITREDLVALAAREGVRLEKAEELMELVIILANAMRRLPPKQFGEAKRLALAALLDRTPERIEAMMTTVFAKEAGHV